MYGLLRNFLYVIIVINCIVDDTMCAPKHLYLLHIGYNILLNIYLHKYNNQGSYPCHNISFKFIEVVYLFCYVWQC